MNSNTSETTMRTATTLLVLLLLAGSASAQRRPLTDFLYFTQSEHDANGVQMSLGGIFKGRIHSNDNLILSIGEFGRATSAGTITISRNVRLNDGYADHQTPIEWDMNSDLLRAAARHISNHHGQLMTWIWMKGEQGIDVFQYPMGGDPAESLVVHMNPPSLAALFVEGEVEVEGEVCGNLTIGSSGNMWLLDDIWYHGANRNNGSFEDDAQQNMLGLLSEQDIIIQDNFPNGKWDGWNQHQGNLRQHSITINAVLCTPNGSFTFEHQNDPDDLYQSPTTPDERGGIWLKGSVIQRDHGYLHRSNHIGTGYALHYSYDTRLELHRPPGMFSGNARYMSPSYERLELAKGLYEIGATTIGVLVLEAGCEIVVRDHHGFTVTDSLILMGTDTEPVTFLTDLEAPIFVGSYRNSYSSISGVKSPELLSWTFERGDHHLNTSSFAGEMTFGGDVAIDSCNFSQRIKFNHAGEVTLSRSLLDGGLYASIINGAATVSNCTILNSPRAGIETLQTESFTILNSIFANNRWGVLSSGLRDPIIRYCDSFDNFVEDYVDCDPGEGCFSADPAFVNEPTKDYHLTRNSACIDSGDPDSPRDPDGTRADVGAHCYPHPMAVPGEASFSHELSLTLAPNPFNDHSRLMIVAGPGQVVEVALYDLTSRMRWSATRIVAASGSSISLDASDLPAGVYLARASSGHEVATVKVVKVD